MKNAFITGITGQDGSYLADLLISKGYEVHGLVRRSSTFNRANIDHIFTGGDKDTQRLAHLRYGDMSDISSLVSMLSEVEPDEVYNLAAQSHVRVSFDVPVYTAQSDAIGVLNLLEAIRILDLKPKIYQASTSELYSGDPSQAPQNELTPFKPQSPYGVAKLYGYEIARVYRDAYDMFICNGILFNHESPRRGENFVTRKIVINVAEIANGSRESFPLGNLDASRDWGYAPEYMEMAWKMLQQDKPGNYVVATGETHTIREFVELAFKEIGEEIEWKGIGVDEIGVDEKSGKTRITINPAYFRPNEVDYLCGDASKAKKELNWEPKTKINDLVKIMMKAELENKK